MSVNHPSCPHPKPSSFFSGGVNLSLVFVDQVIGQGALSGEMPRRSSKSMSARIDTPQ